MDAWTNNLKKIWTALCKYLNQPLFDKNNKLVLDPWKFDHYNKIQFLENCWELKYSSKEQPS